MTNNVEEIIKKYVPINYKGLTGITGLNLSQDVVCAIANETEGILPYDIANGSILYIDKKSKYEKGDYVIIKENREKRDGYRITRALSSKDKDVIGRLMLSIKVY